MKKATAVHFILYTGWYLLGSLPSAICQQIAESPFKISFSQSAAISNKVGRARNATTWYFPATYFIDSSQVLMRVPKDLVNDSMRTNAAYEFLPGGIVLERKIQTRPDSFKLNWFSYYLYTLREPVLYNYPLGKEVYRLTWIRSFHLPVVVSMEKKGDEVYLYTKMLRTIPELPGHRYTSRNGTMHVADTSAHIPFRINKSKRLSNTDYEELTLLIDKLRVLYRSPLGFRNSVGTDGSEWILETHREGGYYFLVRWSPTGNDPLRILGNYLLNLSDAKKETRY